MEEIKLKCLSIHTPAGSWLRIVCTANHMRAVEMVCTTISMPVREALL